MRLKKIVITEVEITPEELADVFLDMNATEQTKVFNYMGEKVFKACLKANKEKCKSIKNNMPWNKGFKSFDFQMRAVKTGLTFEGLRIIKAMNKKFKVN